jgi:hypothetical protein
VLLLREHTPKRPVVESQWSQFTSECQRFGHPPRLDHDQHRTHTGREQRVISVGRGRGLINTIPPEPRQASPTAAARRAGVALLIGTIMAPDSSRAPQANPPRAATAAPPGAPGRRGAAVKTAYRVAVGVQPAGIRWGTATTATQQLSRFDSPAG